MRTAAPTNTPYQNLQGIMVPASSVNPEFFFRLTRRLMFTVKNSVYSGLGSTDVFSLLQVGIYSAISIKLTGTVVVALPTGTAATTFAWPYGLIRNCRITANGQSNLINVPGWALKARDLMARGDLTDRGVPKAVGGASPGTTTFQGTMGMNTENWGLGQNVTAIPAATYNYNLNFFVPLAFDQVYLQGAIFAQTSATDLAIQLDWANATDLFTLTGTATAVVTCTVQIMPVAFSIPQAPDGNIVVPDLSVFHSLIAVRVASVVIGDNEVRLVGQGVGRQLLRIYWRVLNGAVPAPVPMNGTNFGQQLWRFGTNDTPEIFIDGSHLANMNERWFDADLATLQGIGCFDFAGDYAFRDSVDEGAATELRFLTNVTAAVTLAGSPAIEYVQESIFAGAAAA